MRRVISLAQRQAPLAASLLLLALLRAGLLWADRVPFNSDEAVVALMARHILRGERPVFFYGQAYLGSLDAWLVAGVFQVFGESVWAVRAVQVLLYAGTLLTSYALMRRLTGRPWAARLAALWLACPPVVLTLYTTASLGGYGEALLIGNLLWLAAWRALQPAPTSWAAAWPWLALGALTGFGWWVFPLTAVYALPAWAMVLWTERSRLWRAHRLRLALAAVGAGLGAAPWLWATLSGTATLAETGGSALAGITGAAGLAAVAQRALSLVLFAPTVAAGLRPPWSLTALALPLAPLAVVVYSAGVWRLVRRGRGRPWLLGTAGVLSAAFVLTPFGADPSGRYFLPLSLVLLAAAAQWLDGLRGRRPALALGLALALTAFNFWGTLQAALAFPPGLTTQFDPVAQVDMRALPDLIRFLRAHGETRGYTNYWVAYPLAFLSGEDLIFTPRLPYHEDFRYTPRDDRYAPYAAEVPAGPRAAYITTRHPALEARLRAGLQAQGVTFAEAQIGEFHVFFGLSRPVTPEALGLGQLCCP